jgi:hypothetical protein
MASQKQTGVARSAVMSMWRTISMIWSQVIDCTSVGDGRAPTATAIAVRRLPVSQSLIVLVCPVFGALFGRAECTDRVEELFEVLWMGEVGLYDPDVPAGALGVATAPQS